MTAICGLGLESGTLHAVIALPQRDTFIPVATIEINNCPTQFSEALRVNIDILEEELKRRERKYDLAIDKVYCRLPFKWATTNVVEDTFVLNSGKAKQIATKDINYAKKYIENVALEWDEVCLHNIILEYCVDEKKYLSLPYYVEGRKLRLKVLLISTARKNFQEVHDMFENIGRQFMGFVYPPLADLSINIKEDELSSPYVTVNIGDTRSLCSIFYKEGIFYEVFDFGLQAIKKNVQEKFLVPEDISSQILNEYLSFDAEYSDKKLVIKDCDNYVNFSIGSVNSFVKDGLLKEIRKILEGITRFSEKDKKSKVLFIGKLTVAPGFHDLIRDNFPSFDIELPHFYSTSADLLGCIKYGLVRYLEKTNLPKRKWWSQIPNIYTICKEYFS
jgi:hypothetical protein